jgi:hypothetical protein
VESLQRELTEALDKEGNEAGLGDVCRDLEEENVELRGEMRKLVGELKEAGVLLKDAWNQTSRWVAGRWF